MNALPKSKLNEFQEFVFTVIDSKIKEVDNTVDICCRAWEPNIENKIKESLDKLDISVKINAASNSRVEPLPGSAFKVTQKIEIMSNYVTRKSNTWDSVDLAEYIQTSIDGLSISETGANANEYRIKVNGIKTTITGNVKIAELTLEVLQNG